MPCVSQFAWLIYIPFNGSITYPIVLTQTHWWKLGEVGVFILHSYQTYNLIKHSKLYIFLNVFLNSMYYFFLSLWVCCDISQVTLEAAGNIKKEKEGKKAQFVFFSSWYYVPRLSPQIPWIWCDRFTPLWGGYLPRCPFPFFPKSKEKGR